MGRLGAGGPKLIKPRKWDFAEKTRWLYTYFLGKLNTELQTKTISIEGENGLDMYRQICNIVDAVPENFKFDLDYQFIDMPHLNGDKIKGLTELYMFRMLLKSKLVSYNKAIGAKPGHAQLKPNLYVCMDMASKKLASQSGLDRTSYTDICEDIDRR